VGVFQAMQKGPRGSRCCVIVSSTYEMVLGSQNFITMQCREIAADNAGMQRKKQPRRYMCRQFLIMKRASTLSPSMLLLIADVLQTHNVRVDASSVRTRLMESSSDPEQNISPHQLCPTPEAFTRGKRVTNSCNCSTVSGRPIFTPAAHW
jgi:hypothetical protein